MYLKSKFNPNAAGNIIIALVMIGAIIVLFYFAFRSEPEYRGGVNIKMRGSNDVVYRGNDNYSDEAFRNTLKPDLPYAHSLVDVDSYESKYKTVSMRRGEVYQFWGDKSSARGVAKKVSIRSIGSESAGWFVRSGNAGGVATGLSVGANIAIKNGGVNGVVQNSLQNVAKEPQKISYSAANSANKANPDCSLCKGTGWVPSEVIGVMKPCPNCCVAPLGDGLWVLVLLSALYLFYKGVWLRRV